MTNLSNLNLLRVLSVPSCRKSHASLAVNKIVEEDVDVGAHRECRQLDTVRVLYGWSAACRSLDAFKRSGRHWGAWRRLELLALVGAWKLRSDAFKFKRLGAFWPENRRVDAFKALRRM